MDGASGAIAVVSLAVQLLDTVQHITKLFRSIRGSPKQLSHLVETLDQLRDNLDSARLFIDKHITNNGLSDTLLAVTNALKRCQSKVTMLEEFVNKVRTYLDCQSGIRKSLGSLKIVMKREDMQEILSQVRDATDGLQTAVSISSAILINEVRHHSMEAIVPVTRNSREARESRLISVAPGLTSKANRSEEWETRSFYYHRETPLILVETELKRFSAMLGDMSILQKSKLSQEATKRRTLKRGILVEERIVSIMPSFLGFMFEFRVKYSCGTISSTLSTYTVVDDMSDVLIMCQSGDVKDLQAAFDNREVSPYVVDRDGSTLLHHAALKQQTAVCLLLLQLGVDPDRMSNGPSKFRKPIAEVAALECKFMYWKYPMNESNIIDVLRVLVQSQGDFSSQDMDEFLEAYHGPPEGLEMLILHYPSIAEPYEASHESPSYPILATALRQFASDGSEWIAFIRQLVRKKIDLHARVPVHQWEGDSYHRTPLDILFLTTETPYESELAGASWLHVLADEGYSVNEYLKKEMALHDADLNLKIPWNLDSVLETPRRLKFKLGAKPRVLWDWWIDPQSPIYLLSEGFKTMVKTPDDYFFPPSWGRPWPYNDNYLAICAERDLWEPVGEQRKILYRIKEDDNRRQRKRAAKVARARRSKGHRKIPGAWPM